MAKKSANTAYDFELGKITRNAGLQSRAKIDMDTVARYAEDMANGAVFPPIDLWQLPDNTINLARGWHRTLAAESAGKETIPAIIHQGTWDQAVEFIADDTDNAQHGLPLTRDDWRRIIRMYLNIHRDLADNAIASHFGKSPATIASVRAEMDAAEPEKATTERKTKSGKSISTGKIGSKSKGTDYQRNRKVDAALNKIDDMDIRREVLTLAETWASERGHDVTEGLIKDALDTVHEARLAGVVTVTEDGQQALVSPETVQLALDVRADERHERQLDHMNGHKPQILQTMYVTLNPDSYAGIDDQGVQHMMLDIADAGTNFERNEEIHRYAKMYPHMVLHITCYAEDPRHDVKRPARPVETPYGSVPVSTVEKAVAAGLSLGTVLAQEGEPRAEPEQPKEQPKQKKARKPRPTKESFIEAGKKPTAELTPEPVSEAVGPLEPDPTYEPVDDDVIPF